MNIPVAVEREMTAVPTLIDLVREPGLIETLPVWPDASVGRTLYPGEAHIVRTGSPQRAYRWTRGGASRASSVPSRSARPHACRNRTLPALRRGRRSTAFPM